MKKRKQIMLITLSMLWLFTACGANAEGTEAGENVVQNITTEENTELITETETQADTVQPEETQTPDNSTSNSEATNNNTSEPTLDQYGGYFQYVCEEWGYYHVGGYRFTVRELTDEEKQRCKRFADAGLGVITYYGTDEYGGRSYGIMYYGTWEYSAEEDAENEKRMDMLATYAIQQGYISYCGGPGDDALGWVDIRDFNDGKPLSIYVLKNLYTPEEAEALDRKTYPQEYEKGKVFKVSNADWLPYLTFDPNDDYPQEYPEDW